MPFLYQIFVYPIKSLPPVEVPEARVTQWGTLEWDRVYVIVDEKGNIVNGKREPKIHLIKARYDLGGRRVFLSMGGPEEEAFGLEEAEAISKWLTRALGYTVRLVHVPEGMPDDLEKRGPTMVSNETLVEVARWFGKWGVDLLQARLRFRPNLVVAGVPPFWEDSLYPGGRVKINGLVLEVRGISKRCAVPSRDPLTGAAIPYFQKEFVERRRPLLEGKYSDHAYRLVANTVVLSGHGTTIRVLDPVEAL